MKKSDVIQSILKNYVNSLPHHNTVTAFAPSNIALCKYWGKRNQEINLPVTSSLSISLGKTGATTTLTMNETLADTIFLNNQLMDETSEFSKKIINFINLFRQTSGPYFDIQLQSDIPIAAGLASSACGFAALVLALNNLYQWNLSLQELSILARLGSGSAARSLWQGFVEWHAGVRDDGMDSFAEPIPVVWPELCMGLLIVSDKEKKVSSREAMQRTVLTSPFYSVWPKKVNDDLVLLKEAIKDKNFVLLGQTSESNALAMHATMQTASPSIMYSLPETILAMQKVWQLRKEGMIIYFTQDAGPNLKLLFLQNDISLIQHAFPQLKILQPFI